MKKIVIILIGLLLLVIQVAVGNRFPIWNVHMDLLLIYAVVLSMNVDAKTNYICIGIIGFVYDVIISTIFGTTTILLLLITPLSRYLLDKLYEEKFWSSILLFALASIISVIYFFLVNNIFFVSQNGMILWAVLWKKTVINSVIGFVLNLILRHPIKHIMKNWW